MPSPQIIAQKIKHWQQTQSKGFITIEIYPTLRCNLNCSFCDTTDRHRPPVDELSTQEWLQIITESAALGAQQIFILGGGEPSIRSDLLILMQHAKDLGLRGMLTTNGTLLNKEKLLRIIEMKWDEIHFSIDGATPKIHDHLRGKNGTFKKAIRACCFLQTQKIQSQLKTPELIFHFVITNLNYQEITPLIKLAHSVGVTRIDFDALIAYRPEQKALELNASQQTELVQIASKAKKIAQGFNIQTTLDNFIQNEHVSRGTQAPPSGEREGLAGAPCLKAWHHLVIQADGRTSPCCVLAGQGGSIRNQSVETLWNNDKFLEQIREAMFKHQPLDRCKECSWNILSHEREIRKNL
tara:strand:- start:1429 stop:2487 length:1059 start_codon:yes stop_codon:yes gene_type:complete